MNILLPCLFSLVFILIGGSILRYAIKVARKAELSASWPTIEGEIAHSAVLYRSSTSTNGNDAETYKADIVYRYKVEGRDYSSSKISFADLSSTTNRAQSIVERYPNNSKVEVYYNPADPSEAILEPGSTDGIHILYLIGGVFAAGGLIFLLMSLSGHVRMG